MRKLNLDDLKIGQPGLSPDIAKFLVEAAVVCLVEQGHQSGVTLKTEGDIQENIQIMWSNKINDQIKRGWKDTNEAAEYGATAIAALLIFMFEQLVIFERLPQTGDADYYLQEVATGDITAMLEVSGIWKETKGNTPSTRVNIKRNKLMKTASAQNLPTFIIVTEFGKPQSKISKYGK